MQLGSVTVRGKAIAVRRARTGRLFLGATTAGTTASVRDKICSVIHAALLLHEIVIGAIVAICVERSHVIEAMTLDLFAVSRSVARIWLAIVIILIIILFVMIIVLPILVIVFLLKVPSIIRQLVQLRTFILVW